MHFQFKLILKISFCAQPMKITLASVSTVLSLRSSW